jgi:hypothetical protein
LNQASGGGATVTGGKINVAGGTGSTVGGGVCNKSSKQCSTVAGGHKNQICGSGNFSAIGGGQCNVISNYSSTIAGGFSNKILSYKSGILGGENNCLEANAHHSFIIGSNLTGTAPNTLYTQGISATSLSAANGFNGNIAGCTTITVANGIIVGAS